MNKTGIDKSHANYMKKIRIQDTLDLANKYTTDPLRKERLKIPECKVCYYNSWVAGQAFTEWKCTICEREDVHSDTKTPKLCKTCAINSKSCMSCGADV